MIAPTQITKNAIKVMSNEKLIIMPMIVKMASMTNGNVSNALSAITVAKVSSNL